MDGGAGDARLDDHAGERFESGRLQRPGQAPWRLRPFARQERAPRTFAPVRRRSVARRWRRQAATPGSRRRRSPCGGPPSRSRRSARRPLSAAICSARSFSPLFATRSHTGRACQYTWFTAQGPTRGFCCAFTRCASAPLSVRASAVRPAMKSARGPLYRSSIPCFDRASRAARFSSRCSAGL